MFFLREILRHLNASSVVTFLYTHLFSRDIVHKNLASAYPMEKGQLPRYAAVIIKNYFSSFKCIKRNIIILLISVLCKEGFFDLFVLMTSCYKNAPFSTFIHELGSNCNTPFFKYTLSIKCKYT